MDTRSEANNAVTRITIVLAISLMMTKILGSRGNRTNKLWSGEPEFVSSLLKMKIRGLENLKKLLKSTKELGTADYFPIKRLMQE